MKTVLSVVGIRPFRIGGQEVFIRELSSQLGARGWKSVACFAGDPTDVVREYLSLPNVTLAVIEAPEKPRWHNLKRFVDLVRAHRPQVVHLHYTGFLSPYPWLAWLFGTRQVIFTDHSSRPEGYLPHRALWWKRMLARMINFKLSAVTCVSDYGYRCLTALDLLPAPRFTMIYNSVDLNRVVRDPLSATNSSFREKYAIAASNIIVAQISWIIPEKGIVDLIRAARLVVMQDPNVHFVFVGEGAFRKEYSKLAEEIGIASHVTWTGTLEDPFAAGVYVAADIICQVSRWEEVFGYVIAEGMASYKPLIGTNVGGIPELVRNEENGFLVERGDSAQIAQRILTLASDEKLRQEMGKAGRKIAEANFDLKRNIALLIDLYEIERGAIGTGK